MPLSFNKIGFDFWYRGDDIIWSWKKKKWISCGFSGSGEFGDATYNTLRDLDKDWDNYFEVFNEIEINNENDFNFEKEIK